MKRHLLGLLCLILTSMAYGQASIIEPFNSGTPAGWSGSFLSTTTQSCDGTSMRENIYNGNTSGNLTTSNQVGVSNGTDVTYSIDYKVVDWSAATNPTADGWGMAELQYSINDGTAWLTAGTIDDSNDSNSNICMTYSTTIAGALVPSGVDLKFRVLVTWADGDYYFYIDNFVATQVALDPPNCDAVLTSATTDFPIDGDVTWSSASGAPTGYKVTIGSSSGGTDIANNVDVGLTTIYTPAGLMYSTTYYITVVPYNANGDATGCTEVTFMTEDPPLPGSTCDNPIDVGTLPYNGVAETTNGFGDDYSGSPGSSGCGSTSPYLNGDDIVYAYTPDETGTINISLTNIVEDYTGVFVYAACGDIGSTCVDGDVNGFSTADLSIIDVPVTLGQTIYILVSTWATPQTTTFDIDITKPSPPSCDATLTSVLTDFPIDGNITWSAASGLPTGYKITVGSSSGGTDIANNVDVGNTTSYTPVGLMYSTTYYVTIVPYNAAGDATGCSEQTFSTEAPPPPGSLCTDPLDVGTLPYSSAAETTSGFGDDYSGSPGSSGCGSTSPYLNGDDKVYAYTSDEDGDINIDLTNIQDTYTGVFVYDACGDIGTTCLGGDVAGSTTNDLNVILSVANGQTLYIVVSTWATPQTTTYDLSITKVLNPPNCDALLTSPVIDFSILGDVTWSAASGNPTGYRVTIGSTSGGTDIANNVDVGNTTSYTPVGLMYSTTYFITITPYNGNGDAIGCVEQTFITQDPPPPGNTCDIPLDVGTLPYSATAETTAGFGDDYSGSPGSSGCGSTSPYLNGDDKVYVYTSDEDGQVAVSLTNIQNSYTGVFVYGDCADIGSACLGGDVSSFTTDDLNVLLTLTNGQTIYIVVSTWADPQSTTYDLAIDKITPPANDECANATLIACDDTFIGETTAFSTDNDAGTGCDWGAGVWYEFAGVNGDVTVTTTSTGFDHALTIASSADCVTFSNVDCEDTSVGGVEEITFTATAGLTYYFYVGHWDSPSTYGTFDISVTKPAPANDNCATAALLANNTTGSLINQSFLGATPSGLGSDICDASITPTPNDVWYLIDTDADGGNLIVVVEPGPNSDIVVAIYDNCASVIPEQCVDNGGNGSVETINFNANLKDKKGSSTRDADYFVRVYEKVASGEVFEIGAQGEALPIEIGSFEATAEKRGNRVAWTTLSEINSDFVEVQSSPNGSTQWNTIGKVDAKGESTSRVDYEYFDYNPYEVTYYRLNAVDMDGTSEISQVINVRRDDVKGQLTISPNPANTRITVQKVTQAEELATYSIIDNTGKVVIQRNHNMILGLNTIDIELDGLPQGLYMLALQTSSGIQIEKFVKQ